jgi:DNA primase
MSGLIPQSFIDDLLARTDIVDLIHGFVPLKKAGQNYQALCPFHDEKSPSFSVNQDRQFYHCFGCGASGNAISFMMNYNRMDFVTVIEDLAARAGIAVPRTGVSPELLKNKESQTELYELMELVINFYRMQLADHQRSQPAIEYLKKRGIDEALATKFEIGYAPDSWDSLIRNLGRSDPARDRLYKAGLIIRRDDGKYYDRFRQRIMYPIRDHRGRAIGFGGRIIDSGTPKYLNSPETPIFHKGRELYGLYQARQSSRNPERLYVVEGYMDVLALAQFGVNNCVATLGTAATREHLERIFRTTSEIVFCFDGDEAGKKAAWRALEIALPLLRDGREVYFMFLPEGQDPDDFIRAEGATAFTDSRQLRALSAVLLEHLTQDFNPTIREHKARLAHKASEFLKNIPQGNLKQILSEQIATLTDQEASQLEALTKLSGPSTIPRPHSTENAREERKLISQAIKLLLQQPQLALLLGEAEIMEARGSAGGEFLHTLITLIRKNPAITCARILENWRGTRYEKRLTQLSLSGQSRYAADDAPLTSSDFLQTEFLGLIDRLLDEKRKNRLVELNTIESTTKLTNDQREYLKNLNPNARRINPN